MPLRLVSSRSSQARLCGDRHFVTNFEYYRHFMTPEDLQLWRDEAWDNLKADHLARKRTRCLGATHFGPQDAA